MKKLMLLLLPLGMLALASCSSEEALTARQDAAEKQAVAIRPLIQNNTRGESVNLANLKQFRVFAENADASAPALDGGSFTDIVTDGGDGSSWNTQGVHYWTTVAANSGKKANFTGVYPDDMMTSYAATMALDFSAIANGNDQKDHMVAFNQGSKDDNADNGVALKFKHVLSQIVIQASNKNPEERKIEIVGVKLASVKTKNTLTLPTLPTNGNSAYTPYASAPTEPKDMIVKGKASNAITLTQTAQNIMFDEGKGGFMVLPQSLSVADADNLATTDNYISVLCRIYKKNASGEWELIYPYVAAGATDNGAFAFTSVGISGAWEPGKKYTYTLNFYQGNGGAGKVDPDYKDPDSDPDPDPSDPTNPDPDDPKEPDLGPTDTPTNPDNPSDDPDTEETKAPIFFTVTVEDWQNGNEGSSTGDFNKIMQ